MTTLPQRKLLGFGSNYFHALGGSSEIALSEEIKAYDYKNFDGEGGDDIELNIQQLACTTTSSIILHNEGVVYQTGMLHGKYMPRPTRVPIAERVVEIAGGRHFCLARVGSGSVYSWGAGHFGQLGQGPHVSFSEKPQAIKSLQPRVIGSPIVQISCGHWHGAALTEDGRIFCWGSNRKHQCGTKAPSTIVQPQHVNETNVIYSQVDCGKGFCIALERSTGRVYTWGASTACGHTSRKTCISPPRLVEALQRVVVVQVAAGDAHSLAVTGGGRVFSWGSGCDGQLGVGGAFPILPRPKLVGDLDFVAIVASQQTQISNKADIEGATGNNPSNKKSATDCPSNVQSNDATASFASHILASTPKVTEVYAAGSYSLAVSSTGHLYAWGYNDSKVLGLSCPQTESLPYLEPASSSSATLSQLKNRTSQARAFDSRHNILLPRRIDALHNLRVQLVAGGPSHLLIYGYDRDEGNGNPIVGRTLHEVQQARRASHTQNTDQDDISMESIETDAITSATETNSPNLDELFVPSGRELVVSPIGNTNIVSENDDNNKLKGKKVPSTGKNPSASESIELSLENGIVTSEHISEVTNDSSPFPTSFQPSAARSASASRQSRKSRTMSVPKIMQKLTSGGSSKRSNGKERQKRRQFFGSFGGSKN
mmetsp:Transcript_17961/g.27193  ORF Transcript_17961/g.27193 Transcript_17961/m.27193 type:complete len:655 (+) Transcript_17961:180-2144(+)|eukprot:CAMPEP_0178912572 /NCGR_PEP_ID=MMETSP0786-20121207/10348_1 /TAXON_ID=186022 /ORGANISM="Thalassionema frauenfeldii, Strain CCMP 1798" /LENGTH=654 /DNA_ID=CAMNT_0020585191 /DNA_START=150 /DNA_END=2114 /DNA_ORIENTATION=-